MKKILRKSARGRLTAESLGLLVIASLLLVGPSTSSGSEEPLANANKSGLYARSIEQVLRTDEQDIDLATAALIISEQWSDFVAGRRYLAKLDDMAIEIRDRLKARKLKANYKAIAVINEYLFDELGFESVPDASNPDDLFLHSVLDKKRGYCLSLSVLYLSIAERLGMPLYGVVAPGHFFVRYDDGRLRFNIETTSKGGYADDEHYIKKFKVPPGDGSIYMKNLNKKQTLGCFFNNLGNSYNDIGDTASALLALERAVQINPQQGEPHLNLGNIYLAKGQIAEAISQYKAALRINADDAKAHHNLGNAYSKQGRLNDAVLQYTKSLKLDPKSIDAYKNLAMVYRKKHKFAEAISALNKAIIYKPEDAGCYNQLGNVYRQMGNYNQAIYQYKKAIRLSSLVSRPSSLVSRAEVYYGLGVCYNKLGRLDDEIHSYKQALAVEPDMVAALANLGNAYFSQEEYNAAIEQYSKVIRIKPDDATIYYNLGAAYSNSGDYEQAAGSYLKAIEIEPEMGSAHNGLGIVFYNLGKYDLAAMHIKIAEQSGIEISKDLLAAIEGKLH